MKTLTHFLILLLIMLTVGVYALNPSQTLAGLDSGVLNNFRNSLPIDLAEVVNLYFFTLPLWQSLIGLTFVLYLFSRLLRN